MEALALRVNAWAASGQAVMDSLSLGYLDKHEQKTNEEILRELRQSKVPLTQEEETTLAILESYGGLTSFGASKQNQPGPYFAGTAAETVGEMLSGGLTGKIGSSLGKMAGKGADSLFKKLGGKYSKKLLADLAEGRLSDLPMDILDALRDATSVEDFVRRLVGNQALGLVGDSASEGLDAVRQTVRKQGNLGLIAPGQSGKMKSDSDFDVNVDVNASSQSTTPTSHNKMNRDIGSVITNGHISVESARCNPEVFRDKSITEIEEFLVGQGYETNIRASLRGSGRAQVIEIENESQLKNITQIQLSPGEGVMGCRPM